MTEKITRYSRDLNGSMKPDDNGPWLLFKDVEKIINENIQQKERYLTITKTSDGEVVMVSWQDEYHNVLEIVWEKVHDKRVNSEYVHGARILQPPPDRDVLIVNLLRYTNLTKSQARALISHWLDGVEPDPKLFDTVSRVTLSEAVNCDLNEYLDLIDCYAKGIKRRLDNKDYFGDDVPVGLKNGPIYSAAERADFIINCIRGMRAILSPSTSPVNEVLIPTNEDQAAAMQMIGLRWLQQNAPHRLKQSVTQMTPEQIEQDLWPSLRNQGASLSLYDCVCVVRSVEANYFNCSVFPDNTEEVDLVARGMTWDAADSLIRDCVAQAGLDWNLKPMAINLLHRVANAVHKEGFSLVLERLGKKEV